MKIIRKSAIILTALILISVILYGWHLSSEIEKTAILKIGSNPDVPTLVLYTSATVTSPQIPFWAAFEKNNLSELFNLEVKLWRNIEDVQSVMLAGKGDLWIAHTDGFAMAAERGAPVSILAVTGWRKFYIITGNKDYRNIDSLKGTTVAYAPPGSPGVAIFNEITGGNSTGIKLQAYQGRELQMLMLSGKVNTALLPEPLVTMLLIKNPALRVMDNLEKLYGEKTGGPPILPIAGMGVNRNTAEKYPEIIRAIEESMKRIAPLLEADREKSIKYLPESFRDEIPGEIARQSMSRDIIFVKSGHESKKEIYDYLRITTPRLADDNGEIKLEREFLWGK